MHRELSRRYRDFISKVSKARYWGDLSYYTMAGKNNVIIEFDNIPKVRELILYDKIKPRKDYIYHSPDKTITFDCIHIYGLLHIQMLNVIEHFLFINNKELWDELCMNNFKVYFKLRDHNQHLCYTYSFNILKIDDEK